jgi:2-succinyl-6-hydroxy-2,4-cyclohexadiene-1-carboxylate synthase
VPETVVLLHGFGGTRRTWDGVAARLDAERYRPLALDLPGHGQAAAERPITFAGCVARVLAEAPERFVLCGYSMGGRIALHVALAAPQRVAALVLIACSAGIEEEAERAERRRSDAALAAQLQSAPFERFIERWRKQPLFSDEPPRVGELAREDHRRNRPEALAAVLRGVGTGEMRPLWGRLGELTMPAAVLVGDRDRKFGALGRRMVGLLPHAELVLLAGGHALPLENPAAVAWALEGVDPEAGRRGQGDLSPARGQLVLDAREQSQRRQPAGGERALRGERRGRV